MEIKKILIAIDYHPSAQMVAEAGYLLAQSVQAKPVLLHVTANPAYYATLDYSPIMGFAGFNNLDILHKDDTDELMRSAQYYLNKTKSHLGDEQMETLVKSGNIADTILETAKEINAYAIVMGTHSRSGLEKVLVGSVAKLVLEQSEVPLFIIPTKNYKDV